MSKQTVSLKNSGLKLVPKKSRAVLLISYYYLGSTTHLSIDKARRVIFTRPCNNFIDFVLYLMSGVNGNISYRNLKSSAHSSDGNVILLNRESINVS